MKRYILFKIMPAFILLIFVFIGLIKINMINTKALSPMGNTNENYEFVSNEFGDDFSNFIKDNSVLKIYDEDDDVLIRAGNYNFKIRQQSPLIKEIEEIFITIIDKLRDIAEAIGRLI